MRTRDSAGLSLAPLLLRLMLAVTFLWAGIGKFAATMQVQGEQAAILANYGVIDNPRAPAPSPQLPNPSESPEGEPPEDAEGVSDPEGGQARESTPRSRLVFWQDEQPEPDAPSEFDLGPRNEAADPAAPPRVLTSGADFPEPVEVRRWAGLVLALHGAINPGLDPEDSSPRMQLWPDLDPSTEYDPWPRYAALAVALTELIAGILLTIGLLTRLSALGVAGVMLGAMWLTVLGPAIQSGNTHLGVLPAHAPYDTDAWAKPLWLLSLFVSSVALALLGPGTLSLDRLLLGGSKRGSPKPPPKPAGK